MVKVEQERLAMKEQQFVRQLQKVESEARRDIQRVKERAEAERVNKEREWQRTSEEIEERMQRALDENEDMRRKVDRAAKEGWERARAQEEAAKREERQREQYERIVEGLRADVREKDREIANVELRENFKKEEMAREVRELKEHLKKLEEEFEKEVSK